MLAYAANRPIVVDRRPHPRTLLLIIGAHVAVVAIVMSARMEVQRHYDRPIVVTSIRNPQPPPPNPPVKKPTTTSPIKLTAPIPLVEHPTLTQPQMPVTLPNENPLPIASGGASVTTGIPNTVVSLVKSGPQLLTSGADLKPPYPSSKLLNEEEAVLTLKLTIDEQGRVVAVDSVGKADPVFLDAARRHLLAHWRFKAATEDGRAVGSTTVISLHFQLDG
jgi:periplasmic protein TonB